MDKKIGHMNQQPAQAETLPVTTNPIFNGLKVRPATVSLFDAMLLDLPLSMPCSVDFGVDSPTHYGALKEVLFGDDTEDGDQAEQSLRKRIVELEAAMGNGPKLNALVKKYAPQYAKVVNFHTSYDEIREAEEALGLAGDEPVK